jgi:aspartate/methionine/tyrosine aminotransferase
LRAVDDLPHRTKSSCVFNAAKTEDAVLRARQRNDRTARDLRRPAKEYVRHGRFLPHQALAALRFRTGQQDQGRRAPRAPTSSISAWAIPTCRRRKHVIEKLVETAGKPRTDRYSASKGIGGLRRAQAAITSAASA